MQTRSSIKKEDAKRREGWSVQKLEAKKVYDAAIASGMIRTAGESLEFAARIGLVKTTAIEI
jgi:hypothetical protein